MARLSRVPPHQILSPSAGIACGGSVIPESRVSISVARLTLVDFRLYCAAPGREASEMTFPFYSHRTLKEVEETRQLQGVWNAELRGGEPLRQATTGALQRIVEAGRA